MKRLAKQAEIDGFTSVGKWLAGVSGIAIILACSLVIASYAVFIGNPGDCKIRLLAADAIQGGFFYAKLFMIAGLLTLVSVIVSIIARTFHYVVSERNRIKTGQQLGIWQATSRVVDWQLIFVALSGGAVLLGILLVYYTSLRLTTKGLDTLIVSVGDACSAPTSAQGSIHSSR